MNEKNRTIYIFCGAALVLALIVTTVVRLSRKADDDEETVAESVQNDVPDADIESPDASKSDAYFRATARGSSIENYWDACAEGAGQDVEYPSTVSAQESQRESTERNAKDIVRDMTSLQHSRTSGGGGSGGGRTASTTSLSSSTNPYRETIEEREARHQKRRDEAIELVEIMQGRQITDEMPVAAPEAMEVEEETITDGWGNGISSLDDSPAAPKGGGRPIKCMFAREAKIKSGQRVSVILQEDLHLGTVIIPKNTHLMATCTITGRLEMELQSLEMNGRIIALGYEAYDTDGSKGIYCPDMGDASRTVRSRGRGIIGNALGGKVGSIASQVVNTGVSIAESAAGEKTVSVPSGYSFFIMKKKY